MKRKQPIILLVMFSLILIFTAAFSSGCGDSGSSSAALTQKATDKGTSDLSISSVASPTPKPVAKLAQVIKSGDMTGKCDVGFWLLQPMTGFPASTWMDNQQLWWHRGENRGIGCTLDITFNVEKSGLYDLEGNFTIAPDYGIFEFSKDNKVFSRNQIDLYNKEVSQSLLDIGDVNLAAGSNTITVIIKGGNPAMTLDFVNGNVIGYMFGIDYLNLNLYE